jgi:hypothetical protein
MPKRTIILILVLVIVTAGLVWLSVYSAPQKQQPSEKQKPAEIAYAKTTITLSSTPTATEEGTYVLDAAIASNENKITGVQLEISYDPKVVSAVDVLPGNYIKEPVELLKNIDEKNGRISYAIAIKMGQKAVAGSGVIARLEFKPVEGTTVTSTSINFLPKSKVSGEGEAKSVLKSAIGSIIDLTKLTTIEETSPSATVEQ